MVTTNVPMQMMQIKRLKVVEIKKTRKPSAPLPPGSTVVPKCQCGDRLLFRNKLKHGTELNERYQCGFCGKEYIKCKGVFAELKPLDLRKQKIIIDALNVLRLAEKREETQWVVERWYQMWDPNAASGATRYLVATRLITDESTEEAAAEAAAKLWNIRTEERTGAKPETVLRVMKRSEYERITKHKGFVGPKTQKLSKHRSRVVKGPPIDEPVSSVDCVDGDNPRGE